jgi:hypothetical protein
MKNQSPYVAAVAVSIVVTITVLGSGMHVVGQERIAIIY